jgi:hypothetical protein
MNETSNRNQKDFRFFFRASAKLQTMQKNRNWLLAALAAHGKKHSQGDTVRQVQPIHMLMNTQMKRITAPGSRASELRLKINKIKNTDHEMKIRNALTSLKYAHIHTRTIFLRRSWLRKEALADN